jgi:O-antigen/teichoic acid export membrane protein
MSQVVRNVLVTLGTQLLSWALTFLVTLFLPQYLRARGLGTLDVTGAFGMSLSIFVAMGTSTALVTGIARQRKNAGRLIATAFVMRLPLALMAIGVGTSVAWLMGYDAYRLNLVVLSLVVLVFYQVNDLLTASLQGVEAFPRISAAQLAEKLITSALLILMVYLQQPAWVFVAVPMLGMTVSIWINATGVRRFLISLAEIQGPSLRPDRDSIVALARAGLPFFMGAILFALWEPGNRILLERLGSLEAVGWYGLTKRLGGATMMIPVALSTAMLPSLTRLYTQDEGAFCAMLHRLFRLVIVCAVPFAAALIFAPKQLLQLLHYGADYDGSVPVLMLTGVSVILWFLSQTAGMGLIASHREWAFTRAGLRASVVCLPICAASIWYTQHSVWHNGALGSVAADILIEIGMFAAYLRGLPRGAFPADAVWIVPRAALAALPLVYFLHQMDSIRQWYLVVPGILIYASLCMALRCLDRKDTRILTDSLGRKFSRAPI